MKKKDVYKIPQYVLKKYAYTGGDWELVFDEKPIFEEDRFKPIFEKYIGKHIIARFKDSVLEGRLNKKNECFFLVNDNEVYTEREIIFLLLIGKTMNLENKIFLKGKLYIEVMTE